MTELNFNVTIENNLLNYFIWIITVSRKLSGVFQMENKNTGITIYVIPF